MSLSAAGVGGKNFCGFMGWLISGLFHIMYLVGFRTKPAVMLDWFLNYTSSERGSCVITTDPEIKIK
jgi:NADH dehydrogenase FAD-containing subunit